MKILLITFISLLSFQGISSDKKTYYDILACNDEEKITAYIQKLESKDQTPLVKAYIAALRCKKADLLLNPKDKLDAFKEGATSLDEIIKKYPENAEYRYLRLTIQENAPALMRYDDDLENDKTILLSNFHKFSVEMKNIIKDYAKKSDILDVEELE